jgi:hypothetical protein
LISLKSHKKNSTELKEPREHPKEPQSHKKKSIKQGKSHKKTYKSIQNILKSHIFTLEQHKTRRMIKQIQTRWLILHHPDRKWRGETLTLRPQEDLPTQDNMGEVNHSTTRTRTSMDNRENQQPHKSSQYEICPSSCSQRE